MRKTAQPNQPAIEAPDAHRRSVVVGDSLYFNGQNGVDAGDVVCHGKHGVTLCVNGKRCPVRWQDVLGHKQRMSYRLDVIDQGEDGAVVQDDHGKKSFLEGYAPDQEVQKDHEDENKPTKTAASQAISSLTEAKKTGWDRVMTKSVLFVFKGGPLANRNGLHLELLTDSAGHQVHRWKKTGSDEAPQGRQAKPDDDTHVRFFHHATGKPTVAKVSHVGPDGVTAEDEDGNTHHVQHGNYAPHKPVEKPDWAERKDGENDKAYAKRVIDKGPSPKSLPEEHGRYFETKGAISVPISKLRSTKSGEENMQGGDNDPKRMLAAYHGKLGKRGPITVTPNSQGGFDVVDGNGTLTSAKKLGWKALPVKVVSAEEAKKIKQAEKIKEVEAERKRRPDETTAEFAERQKKLVGSQRVVGGVTGKAYASPIKPEDVNGVPKNADQPVENNIKSLYAQAEEALGQYQGWAGKVAEDLGGYVVDVNKKEKPDLGKPGFQFIIGPVKGAARVEEKAKEEAFDNNMDEPDYKALKDIVRGTVAVDSLDDIGKVWETLKASGMKLARMPKDRYRGTGFACEYRDIMMNVTMPNGHIAELQINVKSMLGAKEKVHQHYEEQRTLVANAKQKYGADPDQWPANVHARIDILERKQIVAYRKAWAQITKGGKNNLVKSMQQCAILFLWAE